MTAAHGHSQLQRSHHCAASVLYKNRTSDVGEIRLMVEKWDDGRVGRGKCHSLNETQQRKLLFHVHIIANLAGLSVRQIPKPKVGDECRSRLYGDRYRNWNDMDRLTEKLEIIKEKRPSAKSNEPFYFTAQIPSRQGQSLIFENFIQTRQRRAKANFVNMAAEGATLRAENKGGAPPPRTPHCAS
ncbi:hypothetical protein EVAR_74785_1 [Eumeta japonica]|uniref:Uncharacterized protein n=1 Tax=Eumeta variegata TaxID=151549 RepID=A0A4C1SPX2_EUMVA|nr:hypothetical protein EVAR_74785_1 [Eumeta japonica]